MRWLPVLALVIGCGHAQPHLAGTPRPGTLSPVEQALVERMITDAPTLDAISARLAADRVTGDLGSHEVERLVESSMRWIEHLRASGLLERLRERRCHAPARKDSDVIAALASEPAAQPQPTTLLDVLGPSWLWDESFADPSCALAHEALRALSVTRGWLALTAPDVDVLLPFRDAVERIVGVPTRDCVPSENDAVASEVYRHFFELNPTPLPAPIFATNRCVEVATLRSTQVDPRWAETSLSIRAATSPDDPDTAIAELVLSDCHAGSLYVVQVHRAGGRWRVVDVAEAACLLVAGCSP